GRPFPAVLRVLTGLVLCACSDRRTGDHPRIKSGDKASPEHAEVGRAGNLAARRRNVGGMGRSGRISTAIFMISGLAAGIAPATAQFGGIFGDPPRPPGNVPNRPPLQDDRFMPPVYPQNPQPVAPAPPQAMPPPPAQQGGSQGQPRARPPGLPQPAAAPPGQPLPPPNAPGGPAPLRPGQPGPTPDSAPRPGEEVVTAPPAVKIVNPTAVF